jgi:uncharacterized hydrophobic protein (TIGR00271 family)
MRRNWFGRFLGIEQQRRESIYLELSRSASLLDGSYWLQVFFSAGIATLGLALNSPAVIIGAMLISPLMGPILANGLALAAGDLILGIRAMVKLAASCLLAMGLAAVLVGLLPFKEITAEVAARSHPNTLDLVVALFSGGVGAIAVCKETKGVATSIPGVAIAVALMPPLCIIGYGAGIAASLNYADGARVAYGGGLLFLTNLVAITFTAMLVFLALRMKGQGLPDDPESLWVRTVLNKYPWIKRWRGMESLQGRLLTLAVILGIILVPLSQSLSQLKHEFVLKQEETRVREGISSVWQEYFSRLPDGQIRSYLSQPSVTFGASEVSVQINVFTNKPYTIDERAEFTRLVAARLNMPAESVNIQMIEVPTAAVALPSRPVPAVPPEAPATVAQLQAKLAQSVDQAVRAVRLPEPAQLLDDQVTAGATVPLTVRIVYLSSREIDGDAQTLIRRDVAQRLTIPESAVVLEVVDSSLGAVRLNRNRHELTSADKELLDQAAGILQQFPQLWMELGTTTEAAGAIVTDYMISRWQIAKARMPVRSPDSGPQSVMVSLTLVRSSP